jgi:hypothetical protein
MAAPKKPSKRTAARRTRTSKTPARGRTPRTSALVAPRKLASGLPERVYAQASPHSVGGTSMFDVAGAITQETAVNFASEDQMVLGAASRLQSAGFEVLHVSRLTINIAGPPRLYEEVFGTQLRAQERSVIKEQAREDTATFVESMDTEMPGLIDTRNTQFADVLEGIAIEEPRYFMQNAFAPLKSYWHLRVPGDVSLGINADRAHRGGITGRGVKVMMTDTGWFAHPYFTQRGYRSSPVVLGPAAANPGADEVGHGTAESANAFAVAPDIDFTMVKISFVNTIGGFNAAVALGPQIISNSWGSDNQFGPLSAADAALAAAIAAAVANGVIVVFSAGNGHFGFPGQHPDVISAGGTYMEANGTFRASNYASGFVSNIYPGRNAPDVTGLVGLLPRAAYIMLPLQPGDQIDTDLASGGAFPNGDETAPNDGWAAISGTSAAAPQLAGVCALIRQACPHLTPAEVRDILKKTARDVTTGTCSPRPGMGTAAGPGPDIATGFGLVDANKAVLVAKIRCLGPIGPIVPILPIQPITVQPVVPIQPIGPIQPVVPIKPVLPIQPVIPIQPIRPIEPIVLPPPVAGPGGPGGGPAAREASGAEEGRQAQGGLSGEDVATLERMVLEEEAELDL